MNKVLSSSVTDGTDIAFDLVNEIVHFKAYRNLWPHSVLTIHQGGIYIISLYDIYGVFAGVIFFLLKLEILVIAI